MSRVGIVAALCAACVALTGVCFAASFTLTTAHLGASSVVTPILFPEQVTTVNNGNRAGLIQRNDSISFVYSRIIDQTTMCSGWSNSLATHTLTMTWVIEDNAGSTGDDVLVPGATGAACSSGLHIGAVDLGSSGYISGGNGTISGASTAIVVGFPTTQIQMSIPSTPTGGTLAMVTSGSNAVWTPDPAVTDLSGHNCGANLAQTSGTVQF